MSAQPRTIYLPADRLKQTLRLLEEYRYAEANHSEADMATIREALRRAGLPPCAPGERIQLALKPRIYVTSRPTHRQQE